MVESYLGIDFKKENKVLVSHVDKAELSVITTLEESPDLKPFFDKL